MFRLVLAGLATLSCTTAFVPPHKSMAQASSVTVSASATTEALTTDLYSPAARTSYNGNLAQYLVDLHDADATFDFCGGMMFQLSLSMTLRDHLAEVSRASQAAKQPTVFDARTERMHKIDGYTQDNVADNVRIFHGREVRQVPDAAGGTPRVFVRTCAPSQQKYAVHFIPSQNLVASGMGMALHLSLANSDDPEGWSTCRPPQPDSPCSRPAMVLLICASNACSPISP